MDYYLEIKKTDNMLRLTLIASIMLHDTRLSYDQMHHIARALIAKREELYAKPKEDGLIVSIYC